MGLKYIPSWGKRVRCQWVYYNKSHQIQVRRRVSSYLHNNHWSEHCILNDKGQVTLVALCILLLSLALCWSTLSFISGTRQKILYREQILACTSFLEKKSIELNSRIDTLNKSIKSIRLLELTTRPIPAVAATLQGTRVALELQQQHLAFKFLSLSTLPFKQCQSYFSANLLLFKHQFLILQRDPLWRTANHRPNSSVWLKHTQCKMQLILSRNQQSQIVAKRLLLENDLMKEEMHYGSI